MTLFSNIYSKSWIFVRNRNWTSSHTWGFRSREAKALPMPAWQKTRPTDVYYVHIKELEISPSFVWVSLFDKKLKNRAKYPKPRKKNPKDTVWELPMDVIKSQQISLRPIEKVIVHPLVLLSIVDNYNRVAKDTRRRVVGVLLGSSFRGTVDVTNSYAGPNISILPFGFSLFCPSIFILLFRSIEICGH